MTAVFIEWQLW